jgi:hypothetical protein
MTTVGRWSPNKVRARVLDGTWVSTEELGGMVLLTPTSIAYEGTSATIGANGSVGFTAITNLELRGVFSADYDNYQIVFWWQATGGITTIRNRFMSGTTPESGSNYTIQQLYSDSSTVSAARYLTQTAGVMGVGDPAQRNGYVVSIYGPHLTQPTAQRNVGIYSLNNATFYDDADTHSLSASYDGINIFPYTNSITGLVSVYGLVGA